MVESEEEVQGYGEGKCPADAAQRGIAGTGDKEVLVYVNSFCMVLFVVF